MTCSGLGMKAFGSSRRFSTRLRRSSRRSQLMQKGGHRPSHLRQRQSRAACLPRSILAHNLWTCQDQLIVGTGYHLRPVLGPLWSAQPWDIPEQLLFVETRAMFVRVAQAIHRAHLGQRSRAVAFPDKPTTLGIASTACCPVTDDLNERDLNAACGTQVQVPTNCATRSWRVYPAFLSKSRTE
jgi:hypothetical protein